MLGLRTIEFSMVPFSIYPTYNFSWNEVSISARFVLKIII